MNDIFAYITGKTLGHRKFVPRTSPNKTIGGALGALVLTTALVTALGHFVFADSPVDTPSRLIGLGFIVSVAGQFGDLMLSSVKRDLGIKDMAATIPGHGGLLDRFDSLLLVGPSVFHYVGYFRGFGLDQPVRILTGGNSGGRLAIRIGAGPGLRANERRGSLRREVGLISATSCLAWRMATKAYLTAAHRLQVRGRENLPASPPFILVANHASHLDAVVLGACCRSICLAPRFRSLRATPFSRNARHRFLRPRV